MKAITRGSFYFQDEDNSMGGGGNLSPTTAIKYIV